MVEERTSNQRKSALSRRVRREIHYADLKGWYQTKKDSKAIDLLNQAVLVIVDAQFLKEGEMLQIGSECLPSEKIAFQLLQLKWYSVGAAIQEIMREKSSPSTEELRDILFHMVGSLQSYRFEQHYYRAIVASKDCEK